MSRTLVLPFSLPRTLLAISFLCALLVATPATAQTPVNGQPKPGGTVRINLPTEPSTLNPYIVSQASARVVASTALEGLWISGPDGTVMPALAQEIPTQDNGDVSADGTVVTWKLKHGVTWSDGQPFTSQDLVFTYNVLMDPSNPIVSRTDYSIMQSVVGPDAYTVVVTYKELYSGYRYAFPFVLPAHVFDGQTSIADSPYNRAPTVVTGPFVFKSWASGDTIEFDRNPDYRESGKPYLDQVIYKIMPRLDTAVQALESGDLDVVYQLDETYIPQFQTIRDASIDPAPSTNVEKLDLNVSCSSGPQQGDPACPHPVLGDVRVRQAIALAVDKQTMIHGLLSDQVKPASSFIPVGPYAVDPGAVPYDPDAARQLLDQAGWMVGPEGVRVKNGVRAQLTFSTITDNTFRAEEQQLIQQDLQNIGIETEIHNYPAGVLVGGFAGGSPLSLGNFDIVLTMSGFLGPDPLSTLLGFYGTAGISNAQTQTGSNYTRLGDPLVDDALASAGNTLDQQARLAAFTSFARQVNMDAAQIPLYPRLQVDAHKNYLGGWQTNVFAGEPWNAQDWWLDE